MSIAIFVTKEVDGESKLIHSEPASGKYDAINKKVSLRESSFEGDEFKLEIINFNQETPAMSLYRPAISYESNLFSPKPDERLFIVNICCQEKEAYATSHYTLGGALEYAESSSNIPHICFAQVEFQNYCIAIGRKGEITKLNEPSPLQGNRIPLAQ